MSKWITRERPKIDRIACPWLIRRFIDPDAEIIYVPFAAVMEKAAELGAIPFDVPGVEHTHYGEDCTFDYFVKKYRIKDPAVQTMAVIVRATDTDHHELAVRLQGFGRSQRGWRTIIPMTSSCWSRGWCFMMRSIAGQSICRR